MWHKCMCIHKGTNVSLTVSPMKGSSKIAICSMYPK